MNPNEDLLKRFNAEYGKLTYREMAEITGLNVSRLFRLQNGSAMKVSEMVVFKKLIGQKAYSENSLREIFEMCLEKMNLKTQRELELMLLRKLTLVDMLSIKEEVNDVA
jgi:hypothetical protein